ncbi:MAG: molybdopterin-dependent oxidoreductase [Candidatus Humimicrobiaceae bacterium]
MKRKAKFIISLLVLFLVASLVFFGYYIIKNEYSKRALKETGIKGFDPSKINVDLIKDDTEFARAIPEYKMRFSGLTDRQFDLSFLDLVSNYKDKVKDFTATGTRTDGNVISVKFTGINLSELFKGISILPEAKNMLVYSTDLYSSIFNKADFNSGKIYLAWKKDNQYLNPTQDGFLKIVYDGDKTSKWVKNPVFFDFIGDFDYSVANKNNIPIDTITFISEQDLFTLQIGATPKINTADWTLSFKGLVKNKLILNYEDIIKMPQKTEFATLETISNPAGGSMIGSAFWTGVPFKYILEKAGIKEGAIKVVFYCADGYSTSVTIEEALQDNVILAYKINGKELPDVHGYPVRMVVPDKYGMKWAKWITEIELVDYDFKGFWENQGWSDYAGKDRPDKRFD